MISSCSNGNEGLYIQKFTVIWLLIMKLLKRWLQSLKVLLSKLTYINNLKLLINSSI